MQIKLGIRLKQCNDLNLRLLNCRLECGGGAAVTTGMY